MVVILRMMTALSAFAAIFAATGGGPGSATEILNLYAYRTSFTELNLGYGASLAMVLLAITLLVSFFMFRLRRARMSGTACAHASRCAAVRRRALVSVWAFPVLWGLLTSFKTERDVLAYPPVLLFKPTLDNYREVLFGTSSILPNLWSSIVVATRVDAADDAVRGAGGLCAGAPALSRRNAPPASTCWPRRCCRRWA